MTTSTAYINFINTGSGVNSGDGDSLRTAFNKVNANFQSLLNNFVAAGVASFNSQTGVITFTATDIVNQLGYTPYPDSNPLGFISSGTINFENFASTQYVNSNFVSNNDLASFNFATQNLLDAKLSEYPTFVYIDNQGFIVPSTLPNFLTAYATISDLANVSSDLRQFTTSTVRDAISNNSLIPSIPDFYDLGNEAFRWGTLYLSNAVYINGIGISVDPVTARLFVDGNSVTGGYILTPTSISNGDNLSFTLSATTFPNNGTSKAYLKMPSDVDTNFDPLIIYNTGTKGILFSGSQTNITIDKDNVGISVNTHFISPLRFQGNSAFSEVNTTGNHILEIRGNDSFNVGPQTLESYQQIVSSSLAAHEPLVIKGSRINLFAFERLDSQSYDLENPAFLSLDETGLYVGYNYARGHGAPGRTFDTFEGYKLPLDRGNIGQVLAITSTSTVIDEVSWVTLAGGGNLSAVPSHILPAADLTYDLGSTSSQWRSLYVGTSTVYFGGIPLSVSGGNLTVNGQLISASGVSGLTGDADYTPEAEGDTKYQLNINNDIVLKTYRAGTGPNDDLGPGFSLGDDNNGERRSGVVAIGNNDVGLNAKKGGIYIGYEAGWNDSEQPQGEYAIAIGARAARNIALDNSITLNATGEVLDPDESGLFIKPIRGEAYDDLILFYNPQSGEVTYAANNLGGNSLTNNKEVKVTVGNTEYFAIVNRANVDGDSGVKSSGVAYDSEGNIIALHVVEKYISATDSNIDILVISKFDNVGDLIWQKQIVEDVDVEVDHDLVIDADDNIIVAVSRDRPGPDTIVIIKFNSAGTVLWQKDYAGTVAVEVTEGIDLDSNTVDVGIFNSNTVDVVTLMGDWSSPFNWSLQESNDGGLNWVTLGTSVGNTYNSNNTTTVYYFPQGSITATLDYPNKSYRLRRNGANSSLEVAAMALSGTDIVVAVEYIENTSVADSNIGLLMKVSSTGNVLWVRTFDIDAETYPYGMDVGANGDIVVVGATFPDGLPNAAFAQKFDGDTGDTIWTNILFGPDAGNNNEYAGGDVVIDSQNNIFITVNSNQPIVHDNSNSLNTTVSHVMKLNSAGATQWCRRIGPGPCASVGTGIDCDSQGNVYLAALTTVQNNPVRDVDEFYNSARNVLAVAKYSTAGAVLWQRYIESDFYRFYPDDDTTSPGSLDPTTSRGRNMSVGPNGKLAIQVSARNIDPDGNIENTTYWESITFQIDQDGREMTVGSGNEKFTVKASRIPARFISLEGEVNEGSGPASPFENLAVTTSTLTFADAELAQQIVRSAPYEYVFGNDGTLTMPNDGDIKLTQTQIGWFSIFGPANNDFQDIWIRANCVDPNTGDVYVVGQDDDSGQGFVARYNSEGQILWSIRLNDDDDESGTRCNAVKIHPINGNVVVLAEYFGNETGALIVQIDPDTARIESEVGFRDLNNDDAVNAYDFEFVDSGDSTISIAVVGRKYGQLRATPVTPLTGSTTSTLVVTTPTGLDNGWFVSGTGITGRAAINSINRYTGLTGTTRQGSGSVTFDITDNGNGTYTLDNVYGTGGTTNYLPGHKLKVLGSLLGGVDGVNDAIITITAIDPGGIIESLNNTVEGTAAGVSLTSYTGVAAINHNVGSGADFIVEYDPLTGDLYTYGIDNLVGQNYVENDVVVIPGTAFAGGTSPANDITVTIGSVTSNVVPGEAGNPVTFTGTFPTTRAKITISDAVNFSSTGTWYLEQPLSGEAFVALAGGNSFNLQWSRVLSGGGENDADRYFSVAVDNNNNIYAAGEMRARNNVAGADLNNNWCAVVSKFNSAGTHIWTKALNNTADNCYAKSVAVRGNDIVVTYENNTYGQTVVTKLDGTGAVKWQRMTNSGDDSSAAIDTNGDIYVVTEAFMESDYGNCIKVIKFNSAGEIAWRKILATQLIGYNNTSEFFKNGRNLTLDTDHLYISGYTTAYNDNFESGFLVKIPKSGDQDGVYDVWVIQQDTYDVDKITATEATAFTSVVGTGEFELWSPDFSSTWWDPTGGDNYYHTRVEMRDRDGGAIEFADGTRQTTSAQQIPQIAIRNGADHRLCLDDMGKHIYVTNNNNRIAVPYHEHVPLPIGFTVVIINNSGGNVSIDADGGNLDIIVPGIQTATYWDLASPGMATLIKVSETVWFMTGNVTVD